MQSKELSSSIFQSPHAQDALAHDTFHVHSVFLGGHFGQTLFEQEN